MTKANRRRRGARDNDRERDMALLRERYMGVCLLCHGTRTPHYHRAHLPATWPPDLRQRLPYTRELSARSRQRNAGALTARLTIRTASRIYAREECLDCAGRLKHDHFGFVPRWTRRSRYRSLLLSSNWLCLRRCSPARVGRRGHE